MPEVIYLLSKHGIKHMIAVCITPGAGKDHYSKFQRNSLYGMILFSYLRPVYPLFCLILLTLTFSLHRRRLRVLDPWMEDSPQGCFERLFYPDQVLKRQVAFVQLALRN